MNRISGPLGLPHSWAAMVRPSGVFTAIALYFGVCARPGRVIAIKMVAASAVVLPRPLPRPLFRAEVGIAVLPLIVFGVILYAASRYSTVWRSGVAVSSPYLLHRAFFRMLALQAFPPSFRLSCMS